jgi:hypothetical protein
MRRAPIVLAAVLLAAVPASVLAQSPAPSPAWYQMAPGVSIQALAWLPGQQDPAIFRFRFDPGASADFPGTPPVSLVTIDSGTLTVRTAVDLVIYSTGDPAAAPRTAPADTDDPVKAGDYFLVPSGVAGHVADPGTTQAVMTVANLLPPGAGSAAPMPSASPNG